MEMPGFSAEEISVTVDGANTLTIEAQKNGGYIRRLVSLPEDVSVASVTLKNGLLRVVAPRDEMEPPYVLNISTGPPVPTEDEEDGKKYYRFSIAAPGVAPADLRVTMHPDPRVLEVEIAGSTIVHGKTYAIDKRIRLPHDVETEEEYAPHVSLANGILTLTMAAERAYPNRVEAGTRKLTIESSEAAAPAAEPEAMSE